MELRRLVLLHELSRRGTIAAVAQALSYSPSSVSVALAELEREAGSTLLRRVGRNVELTDAGHRLAAYAEQALGADEQIRTDLATLSDAPRGRVRMTFVQTPALALLPGTLELLAAEAPDLEIELVQLETAAAIDELRSRAVDLVVGIEYDPLPIGHRRDLDREDLLREEVLLAMHPEHRALTRRGPVRLAAYEHEVWAGGHPGTGLDAVLRNVCNRLAGFDPDIRHRSDDALVLSALVSSGRAVALLPALLATTIPTIAARPLREGRLQRSIFTVARPTASNSPGIRAVRAALRRTAQQVASRRRDIHVETVRPAV